MAELTRGDFIEFRQMEMGHSLYFGEMDHVKSCTARVTKTRGCWVKGCCQSTFFGFFGGNRLASLPEGISHS